MSDPQMPPKWWTYSKNCPCAWCARFRELQQDDDDE